MRDTDTLTERAAMYSGHRADDGRAVDQVDARRRRGAHAPRASAKGEEEWRVGES